MKQFISIKDVTDVDALVEEAFSVRLNPYLNKHLGNNKTLGLIFLNPSLRTRLSTQKAAINLGMNVMVMNLDKEGWALELEDGSVMNGSGVEHIKDASAVMGQYCDIIGIRCFPLLKDRKQDYSEQLLTQLIRYCKVPVISLESATLHPLQSFADLIMIKDKWKEIRKPKVVLSWAPHIKALPQAVPNSFAQWMCRSDVDFVITHPPELELAEQFTTGARICYDQNEAVADADFVYVKNWSAYQDYGKIIHPDKDWFLTPERLKISNQAKIMHCLPVRRNLELSDALIDGPDSLILQQADNRLWAAQTVLKKILENI
ncbi:MAG: acetylornithine carbamoyltransferase [Bacteroidota bacterium]|nr:acetylornithine carbamoyltransferase [Bacteroidota bacterium]